MAYQVLARKWRPKQFEEVVGQTHVTRTLQNAIKQNKLAHAYLFTGTRGVGKTSIARLFAKAIRCENPKADFNPCLVCATCRDVDSGSSMDYIEIDGASNNSVDDVRALIENVQYLPTRGKYKIYVIDEVHMLSVSAFNALLKTLEEPPAHSIFILATTDPHKLLGTVISRCQRYDFKNVPADMLKEHVEKIALAEHITFAHPMIAKRLGELGKGSVRDTLSIFDQVLGLSDGNTVTEESLTQALGLAGTGAMADLLTAILTGDMKSTSRIFTGLSSENIDLKKLCDQVLDGFYKVINAIDDQTTLYRDGIIKEGALKDITIAELFWIYESLMKDFGWALTSLNPDKAVQVCLQKMAMRRTILSGDDVKIAEVAPAGKAEGPVRKERTWLEFLTHLRTTAAATAVNLEHGNLLNPLVHSAIPLRIIIAYPADGEIFREYVEQREVNGRLVQEMKSFFECDVEFRTQILTAEEKTEKNFRTKVEIDDERRANREEERRQTILSNPYVKEAEKVFNARVDKIILNEQEHSYEHG